MPYPLRTGTPCGKHKPGAAGLPPILWLGFPVRTGPFRRNGYGISVPERPADVVPGSYHVVPAGVCLIRMTVGCGSGMIDRQVFPERLVGMECFGRSYFRRLLFLRTATVCLLESACRESEKQKMAGEPIKKRIDFFLFTFYAIFASFFTLYPIPAYKSHDSRAVYKHF